MERVKFLVRTTEGHSIYVDARGGKDWANEARDIANSAGMWDRESNTYYPARSVFSVQVLDADELEAPAREVGRNSLLY